MRALHGLDRRCSPATWPGRPACCRASSAFRASSPSRRPTCSALRCSPPSRCCCRALLSALIGVALGVLAARSRARRRPPWTSSPSLAQSLPTFWLGILLIILFAVTLGWLPAGGPPDAPGSIAWLRHLVLPVRDARRRSPRRLCAADARGDDRGADRPLDPHRPREGRIASARARSPPRLPQRRGAGASPSPRSMPARWSPARW